MVLVLLSAQAGCIHIYFSFISCVITKCLVKWLVDKPATVNNMRFFWSSAELQSVGKQLPVASSNDTFYRCHVMPSKKHLHYSRVSKNVTPSLFHLTPLNEQSHSLNPFLLIDFYLCSASARCCDGGDGLSAEVRSLMWKLTVGWVWFPSKQCCVAVHE